MFRSFLVSFRAAFVTSAFTALSITFLTSLAENDAARAERTESSRTRPASVMAPTSPQAGAMRVIDTRRTPAAEPTVQPLRAAKRDRGAA